MQSFVVENLSENNVNLAVEPWAQLIVLEPDKIARFSYDETVEAQIDVSYMGANSITVSIIAADILIVLPDGSELRFDYNKKSGVE